MVIGGPCVAKEYFKNEAKTKEDFFYADGKRWFKECVTSETILVYNLERFRRCEKGIEHSFTFLLKD